MAPGVGKATDMVSVGPNVGSLFQLGETAIDKLEQEYQKMIEVEAGAVARAKEEIGRYVNEFTQAAAEAAAAAADGTGPQAPARGDESAPTDGN